MNLLGWFSGLKMIFILKTDVVVGSTEKPVHMYQATLQRVPRERQFPSFRRELKFVTKIQNPVSPFNYILPNHRLAE
jgi:hypothetical protein